MIWLEVDVDKDVMGIVLVADALSLWSNDVPGSFNQNILASVVVDKLEALKP